MTRQETKDCEQYLPDLLLDPDHVRPQAAVHLSSCPECRRELDSLRATLALMDDWAAPEPSAFFDVRLHARLREAASAAPEGFWERAASFVRFSTGRGFRPAITGALALAMLLGGGTAATVLLHHAGPAASSPTVNDLRIYDNNAQTVQQMDMLDESGTAGDAPQS